MQSFFGSCFSQPQLQEPSKPKVNQIVHKKSPEPIKFKLFKTLNLLQPILRNFALPHKKQKYTFPRKSLYCLSTETNSIPFIYNCVPKPCQSVLIVYAHGVNSTLNHVYDYCKILSWKFGVAVVAYDYTGDGQSKKEFKDYQSDLKCILAWAIKQGFDMRRIILVGFSLGSYTALCLKGQMARILISPICGLTSYVQNCSSRFEGQRFDNIQKALSLSNSRVLITHCSKEIIPIEQARLIQQALLINNSRQKIQFKEITNSDFNHKSAPNFLFNQEGSSLLSNFISKVLRDSKAFVLDPETKELKDELLDLWKSSMKVESLPPDDQTSDNYIKK